MSLLQRARLLGAAALLVTGGVAFLAPQLAAAHQAPRPDHGGDKCYEQVVQYRYERPRVKTQYQYQKQTKTVVTHDYADDASDYTELVSDWSWWTPASIKWSDTSVEVLQSGDHANWTKNHQPGGPETAHTDYFDRDYRYVPTGVTQQVPAGKEKTDWLTAPPEGDGWTQIAQRTVKGDQIPCQPRPDDKTDYTDWVDGTWECGDTTVTQTRTKTVTTWTLVDFEWVSSTTETTETQTRALTETEIESCRPGDREPTYTEWVDGTWECGDTTVTQTRTRTDYEWVNTGGSTWELTETQTVETQTRPLTEAEIESCRPDDREPTYTDWVDGQWECGDTTVAQTRTRTDYTWVNNDGTWELTKTQTVETQDRVLTEAEVVRCNPPTREPSVDREEVGSRDCGATTVEVKVTTTTYSYSFNPETNSWDETATTEVTYEDRPLTPDEQYPCEEAPPAPTISIEAVTPVCQKDAPWIDVTLHGDSVLNGHAGTLSFVDVNGVTVATHPITFNSGETLRFIYPGASVDAAGNPTDWPGWVFEHGAWVVDPTDAYLKEGLTVIVEVNPTASASVSYPQPTEACGPHPTGVAPNGPQTPTNPNLQGFTLPETGAETNLIAAISASLVLVGAGTVFLTRSRKAPKASKA